MTPFYQYKASKSNTNILVVGSVENTEPVLHVFCLTSLIYPNNDCKNLLSFRKATPAFIGLAFFFILCQNC